MNYHLDLKKGQRGSSMVEVMIALFVLVIGMLGVFSLQAKSTKFNQSAYYYTQAVYLANDIAERIRSSNGNLALYDTEPTAAPAIQCDQQPCTSDQIRVWHLWTWIDRVEKTLPNGKAEIKVTTTTTPSVLEILVQFDDSKTEGKNIDAANFAPTTQYYSLVMEI